jgi:hypothetical protein
VTNRKQSEILGSALNVSFGVALVVRFLSFALAFAMTTKHSKQLQTVERFSYASSVRHERKCRDCRLSTEEPEVKVVTDLCRIPKHRSEGTPHTGH